MNVYKVIDINTPYSGGMALVAANNEKEAIDVVLKESTSSTLFYATEYKAILLENVIYNVNNVCIITEEWYYE
jgi:hypothetical protein